MLLIYRGPGALSAFRREPLLARCQALVPAITGLTAEFFYAVDCEDDRSPAELALVEGVLAARGPLPPPAGQRLAVCPRPGTLSAWSTKATEILHNCGASGVRRVERGMAYDFTGERLTRDALRPVLPLLHDRMTEAVVDDVASLFAAVPPRPLVHIPLTEQGRRALEQANAAMGLALSPAEIDYFHAVFRELGRDPTDVELMTFSVVNSEHCRHKIFNATWVIDGQEQPRSLFALIRHTHEAHPEHTLKAYADNAAVVAGGPTEVFFPEACRGNVYSYRTRPTHILIKVETHNHPTAISPYPGASTGVGGEIRDEAAAGIGGRSQAGLCAFFTSHLRLPGFAQPWERDFGAHPRRLATPLQIMTEGPLGAAGFGNEFGRPNIVGLFRTYEDQVEGQHRGYHKPIMVAGGVGLIDEAHVHKREPRPGDHVVQIGGPAMLIGLGGGTASSLGAGASQEDLDFASVQRDNPEMQRRCQELINACIALGADNPIVSIHDLGAGGLSNGCTELVESVGARFDLRAVHNADPGMSPMELWCNEAQERYVLVIRRQDLDRFARIAARERCLFAVIGEITGDQRLTVLDPRFGTAPIDDLDLGVFLGKPPAMVRTAQRHCPARVPLDLAGIDLHEAIDRVLRFPAVASKTFLITIADRTVTGLVARDQMVGPYQVPIADMGMTVHSYRGYAGSAVAMGERTPVAVIDAPASGRLAVAEAITNIAAAPIGPIEKVKLSGNWMCACGEPGEDAALYDTVRSVAEDFCPRLGVAIPVGKDSLSMSASWRDQTGAPHKIVAPLSLVVSAFAAVSDVRRAVTPDLKPVCASRLLLIDLGRGADRLGGSALAQVCGQAGDRCPDVQPEDVRSLFAAVQELLDAGLLLAYHDRSDGGLFVAVAEMAFGGRSGVDLELDELGHDVLAALFSEEIGAVLQYRAADERRVRTVLARHGLGDACRHLGRPCAAAELRVCRGGQTVFAAPVVDLHARWSAVTYRMQAQRDNPECAREELAAIADAADPGMSVYVPFSLLSAPAVAGRARPRIAILREQGVNGQVEMAAAFAAAGFAAVDVTMTDLLDGRVSLAEFRGLAACGGFSYGDVLGGGAGWARTILFNDRLRDAFAAFFARPDTFALGVCNGCQMLARLKEIIPGAADWPALERNRSEQFEARLVTVEVLDSPSVLLAGMAGARLPIPCAHGEGRMVFADPQGHAAALASRSACLRFVDNHGRPTERYPFNPNGSLGGLAGVTTTDGRVTITMPHPERVFRTVQLSWRPAAWNDEPSPWLRLFQNARAFVAGS